MTTTPPSKKTPTSMRSIYRAIFINALEYHITQLRFFVLLAKESGIPDSVRQARLRRARQESANYRTAAREWRNHNSEI